MRRAVLQWPGRQGTRAGWTNDELAELYRVERALTQTALLVETDSGLSDEGDPWFVFCRPDGQVVVHIARIDGLYHLHCVMLPRPLTGTSFVALTRAYVATLPRPQAREPGGCVVAHPSALLSLLVAAAIVSLDPLQPHPASAKELEAGHATPPSGGHARPDAKGSPHEAFARTLASAVWREQDEENTGVGRAWRAVEQAALAFAELNPAVPDDGSSPASAPGGLAPLVVDSPAVQTEAAKVDEAAVESSARLEPAVAASTVGHQPAASLVAPQPPPVDASTTALGATGVIDASGENAGAAGWRVAAAMGLVQALGASVIPAPTAAAVSAGPRELAVTLAATGQSLTLTAGEDWSLLVSGQGELTLLNAGAAAVIDVASRATADIALVYEASSPPPAWQTLMLDGETHVSLDAVVASERPVRLVVDSQGAHANELSVVGADPPAELSLRVVGEQNLTLHESAAIFENSRLDASGLAGALELGVDFNARGAAATDLSVGSGNLVVSPQDSVALENLQNHATIDIGVDLNSAIFGFDRAASEAPGGPSLTLDLGAVGESAPVSVGLIQAVGVPDLSIVSSGDDNAVQTIFDPTLTHLQLSGDAALSIGAIQGVRPADGQSIAIDASGLGGVLTLDVSAIGDLPAAGRPVSIALGAGGGAITDMAASVALSITMGPGPAVVHLADGAELDSVAGLSRADQIFIGAATVADAFVNAAAVGVAQQSSIDASTSLSGAASEAAMLASATAAHEALLFSYRGDAYVFIDAAGGHAFDLSVDAIVKIVGAASTADFSGVFHSA